MKLNNKQYNTNSKEMLTTITEFKEEQIRIEDINLPVKPQHAQLHKRKDNNKNIDIPESDINEINIKIPIIRTFTLNGDGESTPTTPYLLKKTNQRIDQSVISLKQTMNTYSINPLKKQQNPNISPNYPQLKPNSQASGYLQIKNYKSLINLEQTKNMYRKSQEESQKTTDGKMRLRDYIFKAKTSAEVAVKKKRKQMTIIKEKHQQKINHSMASHPSTYNSVFKENYQQQKYTISEREMKIILSQQILEEINKIRHKTNLLGQWINQTKGKDESNISQFYDLRRDLMLQNERMKQTLTKINLKSESNPQKETQKMYTLPQQPTHQRSNPNSINLII